jgi:hypothetical protein
LTRDWEGDAATRRGRLAALRDELARSHAGHRIVLMRRILEHVASRTLLEEILGLVDDRTSLVFDMADFPALSRSTIDFVWNERRHYWTTSTVARIAASKGLALAASTAEATSEPTTIAVVTSDLVPELSLASSRNELKVGARLTALRRCAGEALPMGSSLAVIGASHKGISLLQLVVPSTLASAILDDNPERIGLSVPAVAVHPVRLIDHITEIGPAIAAMCVGDRARGQLTRRLRERGYVGRVVDFMCNDVSDS